MSVVLEFPPKDSFRNLVNFESLYGIVSEFATMALTTDRKVTID